MRQIASNSAAFPISQNPVARQIEGAVLGSNPAVLEDIFEPKNNIAIWRRRFSKDFQCVVDEFIESRQTTYVSSILAPSNARHELRQELGARQFDSLADDAVELIEMFCCLFDLNRVELRMTVLRDSMCPKFHVDHVPCRLVTTYSGIGTQWLPNNVVRREKLGIGSAGKPDTVSGLYRSENDIQQMTLADVALLKGEAWQGNQGAGLVHRSPALPKGQHRLFLSLDFCR